jgi:hypothetical protein
LREKLKKAAHGDTKGTNKGGISGILNVVAYFDILSNNIYLDSSENKY